jgi:RNA polymerase sigma-70 factor (ECF subfamily)
MKIGTGNLLQEVSVETSQLQDLELTRLSQGGNTEAFGKLVTKYRSKIFATVYNIVGNENDAWDIAQEGFVKAWQSIHRFQNRSSFQTWLYSITLNLAIDLLRRKGRHQDIELDDALPSYLPGPRVVCQSVEIQKQVNTALAQLSPEHRAVVVLKDIDDMQCREIAEALQISIGTVMSRLFYARKKLRSLLRAFYNEDNKSPPWPSVS